MSDVAPTAEVIDQVVKDMCAEPGRQFSKGAHAQKLYGMIQNTKFPRKIADLFIDVTLISTPFSGAHSEDSLKALEKLVKKRSRIVDNLLHCIVNLKDTEHSLNVIDFTKGSSATKKTVVSFKKQRALAKKTLEKRNNPEYNAEYYLK